MNKPIGPDLYRCSQCNDLTGMRDGPCGRCAMSSPAPQPTTITKCALCSVAFSSRPDGFVDEALEREAAAHHAVCPKRPIEVGDYVRWENARGAWMGGTIDRIVGGRCYFGVEEHSPGFSPLPTSMRWGAAPGELTRIPRSAEAQATKPPTPALVDGVDREVCLARWMENRMAVEGGAAPPNAMTRMQRDVGRDLWLQRYGTARSAELRERVAADREAERCRVRVDLEVQPWD